MSASPLAARPVADGVPHRSMSPSTTVTVTQNENNAASWHKLLWLPLVALVPASAMSVGYVMDMVSERQAHMALTPDAFDWTYPQYSDLYVTLAGLAVLLTLRVTLCPYVFTPLGNLVLPTVAEKKGKWSEAARADRVQRFSVCLFKLCFFLVMTVFGYSTLKDQNFLPPQLGGSGDVGRAWEGFPYSAVTESVKRYYLLELSYHAHSLVFHLFTVHRNDFVEMTLHHICAVALVIFSYFANWVRVGALVLFLHDIADVTAYAVKAVVDTRYTALTLSCYGALLAAWGYTRLYVFPFFVISKATVPVAEGESASFAWITSYAMLLVLQGLHIYWYTLFLIMGYRFAISGKTVDIQQKAGSADGSYVDYHKTHIKDEHAQEQQNGHHKEEQEWQQEEQQPEQSQLPTKRTNKQTSSKKKGKSKRAE